MRMQWLAAVVTLVGVGAVLGACGDGTSESVSAHQTLTVVLTDAGCSPARLSAGSGVVTFHVENGRTKRVTEIELQDQRGIILGARANVVTGNSGSFTVTLQPGRYRLNCSNSATPYNADLVVTGKPVTTTTTGSLPALLAQATRGYQRYVVGQTTLLLAGTRTFVDALRVGDLKRAKTLFGPTRIHYEAVEPVAESFANLDPEIDARINDVANPSHWSGFHRIEQILWVQDTTSGTGRYATQLLSDVTTLHHRAKTLTYQPAQLANGAVELLNEVANSKITGEEDRYSRTDLSDFQGNLTGARTAFDLLQPALRLTGNGALAATITTRFAAAQHTLDHYHRPTPLGFALYGQLTSRDRLTLAHQVDALAEPLSTLAAIVNG